MHDGILDGGKSRASLPQRLMSAEALKGGLKVKVYFQNIFGTRKDGGGIDFTSGNGLLLIKEKTGGKGRGNL